MKFGAGNPKGSEAIDDDTDSLQEYTASVTWGLGKAVLRRLDTSRDEVRLDEWGDPLDDCMYIRRLHVICGVRTGRHGDVNNLLLCRLGLWNMKGMQ